MMTEFIGGVPVPPASPPVADDGRVAYTVPDFSKRLSISESFTWKMLGDGRLSAVRVGRRTLIPATELTRLMKARAA